jgi:hypothetical protein
LHVCFSDFPCSGSLLEDYAASFGNHTALDSSA